MRQRLHKIFKHDGIIILLLIVIAAIPRVIYLDSLPPGIHGDEGWTGIDARRIIKQGFIEPYTNSALGQPTGPMYMTALFFRLFGESIFTLRLSLTIFAIATVPVLYLLLKLLVSKKIALFTALLFSFSLFHLHYSRIAFMLISAPLLELLAIFFFIMSEKRNSHAIAVFSGICTGLGMYTYNAFIAFPALMGVYTLIHIVAERTKKRIIRFVLFAMTFSIVASPLLYMMATKPDFYFSHHRLYSIFSKPVFSQASLPDKINLIASNTLQNLNAFFFGHAPDGVDGFGKYYSFSTPVLILFAIGIATILSKREKHELFFLYIFVGSLLATGITVEYPYRRLIDLVPLIYIFSAYGISYLISFGKTIRLHRPLQLVFVGLLAAEIVWTLTTYFGHVVSDDNVSYTFTEELTKSIRYVTDLSNQNNTILLFSDRWNCNYETVRFLAPSTPCETRSNQANDFFRLKAASTTSAYILLNSYQSELSHIQTLYPRGKLTRITNLRDQQIGLVYVVE